MKDKWLMLGTIGKPYGVAGAFFVSGRTEGLPRELSEVLIGKSAEDGVLSGVLLNKMQGGRPLLKCTLFSKREDAEKLRGERVWVRRGALNIDHEKEYFWDDLIGKSVEDVDGGVIGTVYRVHNYGASDVVFVKSETGRKCEIPLVSHYFDMGFLPDDDALRLVVSRDIFDEAWE
ncbi:MAG: 16S rRNA processing protein RimM [Oligoflexales bacterium]|nr:16S rRNA processing protein RimM [Oligoflexales bacterium]